MSIAVLLKNTEIILTSRMGGEYEQYKIEAEVRRGLAAVAYMQPHLKADLKSVDESLLQ